MIRNTVRSWGSVSRAFHWVLGLAVIGMLAYGWWMNHIAPRPDRLFYRTVHADIGYALLLAMVLRLIWRWMNPVPALPAQAPIWERIAARVSHVSLYAVTIGVALLGWAMAGARSPAYDSWFGLFNVPQFLAPDKALGGFFERWHIWLAYVLMGLVALHILAALFHLFVRDDAVAQRMISGEARDQTG